MGKDAKGEAIDPELAEIYAEGVQVQTRLLEMLERVLEGKAAADQQRNYGSSNATMNVKVEGKGLTIAVCCAVFSATMFLASLIGFGMLYLNMKDPRRSAHALGRGVQCAAQDP